MLFPVFRLSPSLILICYLDVSICFCVTCDYIYTLISSYEYGKVFDTFTYVHWTVDIY